MRALDLPPAVPVGHDLGGGVVQIAGSALRAPLRTLAGARNFVAENHPDEVAPAVREVVEATAAR